MNSTLLNKVIDGLEHCIKDVVDCDGCPYKSDDWEVKCMNNLMQDSLCLIKYSNGETQGAGYLVDWDTPHEI